MRDEAGFRAFVQTNGATLQHAARLLTGDHHRGRGSRADRTHPGLPEVGPHRRPAGLRPQGPRHGAHRLDAAAVVGRAADGGAAGDGRSAATTPTRPTSRDQLRRLLAELAPRERAVIVLRYYCDLSEQDAAATLGIPVGTVKSTCSRALARLRVDVTAGGGSR